MKKILISMLITIFIVSMFSVVNAATGNVSLNASLGKVKPGGSFTITVVGSADSNIMGLDAKISYDKTKLSLDASNSKVGADFSNFSSDAEKIEVMTMNPTSKNCTLYTIAFKVLDNAVEGDTKIDITDITLALAQENISVANKSVSITVAKEQVPPADTTAPIGNVDYITNADGTVTAKITFNEANVTITNNDGRDTKVFTENGTFIFEFKDAAGNKGTAEAVVSSIKVEESEPEKPDNTNNKVDNTTPDKGNNTTNKLPQTGVESVSVMVVIALGIVAIVSLVAYRRYKDI